MVNEVLESVYKEMKTYEIWLADTTLPEGLTDEDAEATIPPIDQTWHSPFVGQPIEEAFKSLASIPLEKSLNREFLIVLDKALYDRKSGSCSTVLTKGVRLHQLLAQRIWLWSTSIRIISTCGQIFWRAGVSMEIRSSSWLMGSIESED
jgi:hypothetical protein